MFCIFVVQNKNQRLVYMKATKFTEMSSLEWQEAYASVKNAIDESIKVCPSDCVSSYKDMDLDTYWNNLIAECWYEKDGEECHCDGFSIISQYILVEDEEDEEGLRDMFEQARDSVWESFIEDICECDDDCDEMNEAGIDDNLVAYDCYSVNDASAFGDYRTIFSDVLGNGGSTRQFAKYFGFSVYNNNKTMQLEVFKN